jgi:alginate O-acetyltransferase complex protein AlgJ
LRAPLIAAKSEYLVYYPTDTHWTGYGAYIAYREIIQHLQPGFQNMVPYGWDEVTITQMEAPGGDLAGMLTLQDNFTEQHIVIGPLKTVQCASVSSAESTPEYTVFLVDNADLPRALVFHDSFFPSLRPLFAEHFSWSLYRTWQTDYDLIYQDLTNMITESDPDVVILEIVERWIYQLMDPVLLEE